MSRAVPTAEEMAAIVAAVELLWPRPEAPAPATPDSATPAWRFSGRWWTARPSAQDPPPRYHPGMRRGRSSSPGRRSPT